MIDRPVVRLVKPLERHLAAGHPWLYRDALRAPPGIVTGTVVDVHDRAGQFVARGLYDARSPIAVRVVTTDAREAVGADLVRRRVEAALAARRGAFDPARTNAFRWVNGEGDLLPGVVVDVYRHVAVLRLDGEAVRVWRDDVVRAVVEVGRAMGIAHVYERARGGRGEALHGGAPPVPIEIHEHGVRFGVDVVHGQKTGFFLDQRENRRLVGRHGAGASVANVFGYTGGFSVYAACGGARHVVTVDSAAPALEAAQENFRRNDLDTARHTCICGDAFEWLRAQDAAGCRHDVVIVDPPSFAPSERSVGRALGAYRELHRLALRVVAPGGLLAAASCSSHVTQEAFLGALRDAAAEARVSLRVLEVRGQPADHPTLPAFPEGRYLKFVLARR